MICQANTEESVGKRKLHAANDARRRLALDLFAMVENDGRRELHELPHVPADLVEKLAGENARINPSDTRRVRRLIEQASLALLAVELMPAAPAHHLTGSG